MSALAYTLAPDEVAHNLSGKSLLAEATSDISVITRIDYNLRFTKQAVLVVAQNTAQYSQLASQYLVSLSNDLSEDNTKQINVAFVSASTKLNDIQIRCRLVEQLFVNTLFDPEQSLAVSALKLAKQQGEAITIVVDHAHALSLQIKYELCQLVSLAKKHKLIVNVVIFGLTEAAQQLSANKSLFKNKMTVIDAETGQVLSLDDNKIQRQKPQQGLTFLQKLGFISILLIIGMILTLGYLLINEDINEDINEVASSANKGGANTVLPVASSIGFSTDQLTRKMQKKEKTATIEKSNVISVNSEASSEEIGIAILALSLKPQISTEPANASDVINALALTVDDAETLLTKKSVNGRNNILEPKFTEDNIIADYVDPQQNKLISAVQVDHYYYQNQAIVYDKGYVVQIAGFSDEKLWQRFIKAHPKQRLFSYHRELKESRFIVVTSKVYADKAAAKAALQLLPASLNKRKPWLKDISSVINEINTFKR